MVLVMKDHPDERHLSLMATFEETFPFIFLTQKNKNKKKVNETATEEQSYFEISLAQYLG